MSRRHPHLVVIGAGIAGLSAGVYAARSGYRVTILEMHTLPGGLCTSWTRKGYRFDGSIAGLAGTSPDMAIHRLWRDLGVVDGCALYDPEDFGIIVGPDGRSVTVFTDAERLEAEFLAAFPADATAVREFCAAVRACGRLDPSTTSCTSAARTCRSSPYSSRSRTRTGVRRGSRATAGSPSLARSSGGSWSRAARCGTTRRSRR
jgi:phytoene dehydrogenase-like protein